MGVLVLIACRGARTDKGGAKGRLGGRRGRMERRKVEAMAISQYERIARLLKSADALEAGGENNACGEGCTCPSIRSSLLDSGYREGWSGWLQYLSEWSVLSNR